jgi:hypothetical protein
MATWSQTKLHEFHDFSSNFAKNLQLQLRFFQRRKKIFDFSIRVLNAQTIVFHKVATIFLQSCIAIL